jgi:hypothetical protein
MDGNLGRDHADDVEQAVNVRIVVRGSADAPERHHRTPFARPTPFPSIRCGRSILRRYDATKKFVLPCSFLHTWRGYPAFHVTSDHGVKLSLSLAMAHHHHW